MQKSDFQILGKPIINKFEMLLNKDYSIEGEVELDLSGEVNIVKGIDETAHQALVTMDIGIFTTANFEDVPFRVNIVVEGHFNWNDELEQKPEALEVMLKQNAPAILYSYARPLITLMTVEAGMPPLVIPMMNFVKK